MPPEDTEHIAAGDGQVYMRYRYPETAMWWYFIVRAGQLVLISGDALAMHPERMTRVPVRDLPWQKRG